MKVLLAFSLVLLISCAVSEEAQSEGGLEEMGQSQLSEIDIEACKDAGGRIQGVGLFGVPACIHSYPDAGKACSDGSECTGRCIIAESPGAGVTVKGVCEENSDPTGCYALVVEGGAQETICYD